jgi:NAD-dependent dihydropyrimidine dehydrogenase PreA subunit
MKTVFIHYFTGTGNTAHSVKMIAEQLRKNDFEIEIFQVKKGIVPPDRIPDFHIIAFPVLSWAAPILMKKYITAFSSKTKAPTAILAIQGAIVNKGKVVMGYSGQALEEVEKILKRKQYDVFHTGVASFPDNWTQVTNPCKADEIDTIFKIGDSEVEQFIMNFLNGKRELYRCGIGNIIWSYLVSFLFGKVGRRVLGKFYIADEHCTGCGICVKSCPVNAIAMGKEKPWWGTNCEDCNCCINCCPEKAIQVSVPVLFIQLISNIGLTVWSIIAILTYFPQWLQLSRFILIPIEIVSIVGATLLLVWVAVVPIDAFLRLLMRIPGVRRFFSKSYTSSYRRYLAPGFKPFTKI